MKKLLSLILVFLTITSFGILFAPDHCFAAPGMRENIIGDDYGDAANAAGYNKQGQGTGNRVTDVISMIIRIVLGLLGILFMIYMIYGGFLWMTAAGNEEQVTKAKKLIKNAVIGLLVILAAYSVSWFVLEKLIKISTEPGLVE